MRQILSSIARPKFSNYLTTGTLTVDEALRGVTFYAARQMGLSDEIGSLESGKEADLTIFESDPYTIDPEKIMDIKVSETWLSGEKKYG